MLNPTITNRTNTSLTFSWTSVPAADYIAVLATDNGYKNIVANSSGTTSGNNTRTFTSLSANTTYYFEVKLSTETDIAYYGNHTSTTTMLYPAPTIAAISPSTGISTTTQNNIQITGTDFVSGATVKLAKTGQSDIMATNVVFVNATQLICSLPISGAALGQWNVVVTNPDGQFAPLTNGFTILAATNLHPQFSQVYATNAQISWDSVTGASYIAVLALDSGFSTVVSSLTLSSNSAMFADLLGVTTYYFEVKLSTETDVSFIRNQISTQTAQYTPHVGNIITIAGNGTGGYSGDGGQAFNAELNYPVGVVVDSAGNAYVSDQDNHRVRKIDHATGVVTTVVGNGNYGYNGDSGEAIYAHLASPMGVALDSEENIYIADSGNNRVRKVTRANGIITTVAGNGSSSYSGDGGQALNAGLDCRGIAVDSAGNIYIADYSNRRIRKIDYATGIITTVAGNGASGYTGDGGPATSATFQWPSRVAIDFAGDIYIADSGNNCIRKVNHATGIITTVAGNGASGYGGDGGLATNATLYWPYGLAFDSGGNMYIADRSNHRIRKVDYATGIITTVAGNGTNGYSGDGGPAPSAKLYGPGSVALDDEGNVYIADVYNHRVRKIFMPLPATLLIPQFTQVYSTSATVTWNAINDAQYVAILASDSGFGNIISSGALTTASTTYTGLLPDTSYYCAVKLSTDTDGAYPLNVISTVTLPVPVVVQITPVSGLNTAVLNNVQITGSHFASGATVKLTKSGQADIAATNVSFVSSSQLTCTLPLIGAAAGQWNVIVTNPDGQTATFSSGFIITPNATAWAWTGTGAMLMASAEHTATLLSNGTVLVSGGWANSSGWVSSAEIYDPSTGQWTVTGSMTTARQRYTTTLLSNGKVLAVGGNGLSSSEIYDPLTGQWTVTGSMTVARQHSTATLLPNGKVLVAGGYGDVNILSSTEIYDPATGQWTSTGFMSKARAHHTATLLPNGKVLVAGGAFDSAPASSVEIYDPSIGQWTITGSMSKAREFHTATLLPNGKVLVAGGCGSYDSNAAEVYDPSTGQWSPTGLMSTSRDAHTATLLPNGKVLVAGGSGSNGYTNTAEIYNPSTGQWTTDSPMFTARFNHISVFLPNGKILIAGGYNIANAISSAELYTPVTSLSPSFSGVYVTSATVNWTAVAGASYNAVLALDSGYSNIVSSGALTANTTTYTGLSANTTYYFEVKLSTDVDGAYSVNTASAQTQVARTPLSPQFSNMYVTSGTVSWNSVPGASYVAVLASDSGFGNIVSSAAQTGNSVGYNLSEYTTYYFEVKLSTETDAAFAVNRISTATLYYPPPTITSISPASASNGWPVDVQIDGADFLSGATVKLTRTGQTDIAVSSITFVNASRISCTLPLTGAQSGQWSLMVTNPDVRASSATAAFTVTLTMTPLNPRFSQVSVTSATVAWDAVSGAAYTTVLATDSDYTTILDAATMAVGVTSKSFTGLSEHTTYYFEVKLSTEANVAYAGNQISTATLYYPPPAITSLSPGTANNNAPSAVQVNGANFLYGASVKLQKTGQADITANPVTFVSAAQINCTLPIINASQGQWSLVVANPDVRASTAAAAFDVTVASSPLHPQFSQVFVTSATVTWDVVPGASYIPVLALDNAFSNIISSGILTTAVTTYTGLSAYTNYYFAVKLSTDTDGAYSGNTLSAQTQIARTPLSPQFSNVYVTSATVNWTTVPGVTYVAVLASDNGFGNIISSGTLTAATTTYIDLSANTAHYFGVKLSTETDAAFAVNRISTATLYYPPPTITSISPASASNGWPVDVQIDGADFLSGATVKLTRTGQTDIAVSSITFVNASRISCTLPLTGAQSGQWSLMVTNPDVRASSATAAFTVTLTMTPLNPRFSQVSVTSATVAWDAVSGAAYTTVLATDSDYTTILDAATMAVGVTSKSFTGLSEHTTYYFEVKLSTEANVAYAGNQISTATLYYPPPAITSLSPGTANNNAPSAVQVNGANFLYGASVKLQKTGQADITANPVTFVSAAQINCTLPIINASQGQWSLVVANPDVRASTAAAAFDVTVASSPLHPQFSQVFVTSATVTWDVVPGASYIPVLALDNAFSNIISSGAQTAASRFFTGLVEHTTYYFQVKLANETDIAYYANQVSTMTLLYPLPAITSVAPVSAINNGSVFVQINGNNFVSTPTISLTMNGLPDINATSVVFVNATKLTCVLPIMGAQAGVWSVTVTNPDGQGTSLAGGFTVLATTNLHPRFSQVFVTSATVTWDDVPGAVYMPVLASDGYVAISSAASSGHSATYTKLSPATVYFFEVKLSTETDIAYYGNRTSALTMAYLPPHITGITPAFGANTGSLPVIIEGDNFLPAPTVKLTKSGQVDITVSSVTYISATKITCTLPITGAAPGQWNVVVTNSDGQFVALTNGFTILAATSLHPQFSQVYITSATVTWDSVSGASYVPVLAIDDGFGTVVSSGAQSGASKIFTGLTEHATYYFEVKLSTETDIAYGNNRISTETLSYPVPGISGLAPDSGVNSAVLDVQINGGNFLPAPTVKLTKSGQVDITVSSVTYISATKITCTLPITGAAPGQWNVVVTNSDGQFVALTNGFTILAATSLHPQFSQVYVTSATVTWDAIAGVSYTPVLTTDSGYANVVASGTQTGNTSTFTGLTPNTGYYFEVKLSTETDIGYGNNRISTTTRSYQPPLITQITPASGINIGPLNALIEGSNFMPTPTVKLTKSGQLDIVVSSVTFINSTQLTCALPITGAQAGQWNVVVVNSDNQTNTLSNGFAVQNAFIPPTGKPGTPSAGSAFVKSLVLTWSQGTAADLLTGITGYHLEVGVNPQSNDASLFNSDVGLVLSTSVLTAQDGTYYYARVCAKNAAGICSAYSDWSAQVGVDLSAPVAPIITSPTHPEHELSYCEGNPSFALSGISDFSGVAGYYWKVDQNNNTVPSASDDYAAAATIQINSPLADGTWYFHAVAKDDAGNVGTQAGHYKFILQTAVNPSAGHTYTMGDGSSIVFPSGAVLTPTFLLVRQLGSTEIPAGVYDPNWTVTPFVKEIQLADGTHQLNQGIVITLKYTDAAIGGLKPASLKIAYYDTVAHNWQVINNSVVDTAAKTVTAIVNHLTAFAIIGSSTSNEAIFGLSNYPNPFAAGGGGATKIRYSLSNNAAVQIRLYDLLGKLVYEWNFSAGDFPGGSTGPNEIVWDGKNGRGNYVAAGGYICLVKSGGVTVKTKIGVK